MINYSITMRSVNRMKTEKFAKHIASPINIHFPHS